MSTATKTTYTPEDLLEMPDGDNYELVDGQLVERTMGFESSFVAGRIHSILLAFCEARGLGWVVPEGTSYQCFPQDRNKVRRADVSFVSFERIPPDEPFKGHCSVAPNLVAEVISPRDLAHKVEEKIQEYLSAGVQLVWVFDPATRTVRVQRADGTAAILQSGDELSGENVLPGFNCRVSNFYRPPAAGSK